MRSEDYGESYWERGVGSNYVSYGDDPGWPVTVQVLARYVVPGAPVFEVGSAKGWFLAHARAAGFDARGMDISSWAVEHAAPGMAPMLQLANAATTPILPRDTYRAVVSWEFLEHVPLDELVPVLQNMERAVRPGGLLVHRVGIEMPGSAHGHQADVTHQQEMPREWWHGMFAGRGWQHRPDVEASFDVAFLGRDWAGRFFAYRMPR
jgi:SAM-dependent methyltransferase